jgi:hypothetical protein
MTETEQKDSPITSNHDDSQNQIHNIYFVRFRDLRPNENRIRQIFEQYGEVDHCKLPIDVNYGFVYMKSLNAPAENPKKFMDLIYENMRKLPSNERFSITIARPPTKRFYVQTSVDMNNIISQEEIGYKQPHPYSRQSIGLSNNSISTKRNKFPTLQQEQIQKNSTQPGRNVPPYRATVSRKI